MKCPLCGYEFRKEESKATCNGCPMGKACHMKKCPNCNYEIPDEPGWIKALRALKERKIGTGRKI